MDKLGRRDFVKIAVFASVVQASALKGEKTDMDRSALESEALATVEKYNRAWTLEHAPERLKEFFHPEMVAISPGALERIEGAESCIAGWSAFADANRVTEFRTHSEKVQLWGGGTVAVVTYCYEMSWEKPDSETVNSAGLDMFVLARENGRWWAVADQFSTFPKLAGE